MDYALFEDLARPVPQGRTKLAGIKLYDARMTRLMELLLHAGLAAGGFTTAQLHRRLLERFELGAADYTLTQLRYDLRKLKAHGLIAREGRNYRYVLSEAGRKACPLFVLFHKRVRGPLAGSLFVHRPSAKRRPPESKLESAYHKADQSIEAIIELLAA